jgi:glutamate/tyrosine decarboxylase-like PLP-dependent enzyme
MEELELIKNADTRASNYLSKIEERRVFPSTSDINALDGFIEPLPEKGRPASETLGLMDKLGSPATVASNGPNYFGFVIGATLPVSAAAERLALAWDQCASSFDGGPSAAVLEQQAAKWVLDILDLPRKSVVGFGTSATACGLACLSAARSSLLASLGWDFENYGLVGAPEIKVVVPDTAHITVKKALRILGFGLNRIIYAPTDGYGRIDPAQLPEIDKNTILCLQAGEVNTGEFDQFDKIIPIAKNAGAWVHVDGAFGLWARASKNSEHLTLGIDGADSWTTDGHKWLNTPYDGAIAICRDKNSLARAMNSDAAYSNASADAQKNLSMEFSRRARGIPIWAALRTLGKDGVADMVDQHIRQAQYVASELQNTGYTVLNRVVLNQVLVRANTDEVTQNIIKAAQNSGRVWFGETVWENRPAFRISISSWRTQDTHIKQLVKVLEELYPQEI